MAKLTVNDIDLQGKRVLTRVDYNVPMAEQDGAMVINDDTRIRATLPTLKLMIENGAKVILTAHLGRPKGERVPSMSLRPVADKLAGNLMHDLHARRWAILPRDAGAPALAYWLLWVFRDLRGLRVVDYVRGRKSRRSRALYPEAIPRRAARPAQRGGLSPAGDHRPGAASARG